jgi:4-hydroxybenzoate polyprenyltransferase
VYTLPFEIRDLHYDSINLKTIPQVIGINKTKVLAYILLILFCFISFFIQTSKIQFIFSDIIIAISTAIFIFKTKEKQSRYFTSFFVEGIPIFWLLVIVVIESI